MTGVHGKRTKASDEYHTPPWVVKALGPFDTDPCVSHLWPHRTARRMYSLYGAGRYSKKADGLTVPWTGRVWLNPPYSRVKPWAERFVEHANGIALVSAKSTDAAWAQLLLSTCDLAFFLSGRLVFHHNDGAPSGGAFLSSLFIAHGPENAFALQRFARDHKGVLVSVVRSR